MLPISPLPCCASGIWRSTVISIGRLWPAGKWYSIMESMLLLYCMASSPGQVFSKAQLYEAAWGEAYLHGTNSVENIIWRLRQKLEDDPKHPVYIKTVIRSGYKIEKPR